MRTVPTRSEKLPAPSRAEYGYDPREGAKGYAPILGGIGGFVVAAVVLVFTIRPPGATHDPVLLAYTAGLLVLGLIGTLTGAFGFAAIGAERQLTPNLIASTLYAGVNGAVGVVAVIAAFQVLAAEYLPQAGSLFPMITLGVEVSAVALVSLVLGDAWTVESSLAPEFHRDHWLGTKDRAYRAGTLGSLGTIATVSVGGVLYFLHARISLGAGGVHVLIGAGIGLTVAATLAGIFWSAHTTSTHRAGLRKVEAIGVLSLFTAYLTVLMVCLP